MRRISNLAGVFTGQGFVAKRGRSPTAQDCGFIKGPVDLVIDDAGLFCSIEATGPNSLREASFDGSGLVATAGFCDAHTHALFAGDRSKEYFLRWKGASYKEISDAGGGIHNSVLATASISPAQLERDFSQILAGLLKSGTTTLEVKTGYARTGADELKLLRFLRSCRDTRTDLAKDTCPDLRTTFLGLHALPKGLKESDFVDEMISILDAVAAEKLAEFIDAFPEKGFFSLEEARRFIEAGQKRGLKAKIHADELSDMNAAQTFAQMGALSVDHLQKINAQAIEALASSQTVALMLPATSFFLDLEYAPARKLWDSGVQVGLASDFNPGTAPEGALQLSFRLAASKMKMSAPEILCASTYNGAAALGLAQSRGTLQAGRRADMLLWKTRSAEPLEEIFVHGLLPEVVFKNGRALRF